MCIFESPHVIIMHTNIRATLHFTRLVTSCALRIFQDTEKKQQCKYTVGLNYDQWSHRRAQNMKLSNTGSHTASPFKILARFANKGWVLGLHPLNMLNFKQISKEELFGQLA